MTEHNSDTKANHCPNCGDRVRLTTTHLAGEAPCPRCGAVLSFVVRDSEVYFVERVLAQTDSMTQTAHEETLLTQLAFESVELGARVRILHGAFEKVEGTITEIDRDTHRIGVTIELFGRPTVVDVAAWQLELVV